LLSQSYRLSSFQFDTCLFIPAKVFLAEKALLTISSIEYERASISTNGAIGIGRKESNNRESMVFSIGRTSCSEYAESQHGIRGHLIRKGNT
jgi:hypothetical protein